MFVQTWRQHWGILDDPFACEDADKDMILGQVDVGAVHSGFDRLYGDPQAPGPGIVFGEKGSGKSGLRLMMRRHLETHNAQHPQARMFLIDYIDFDLFLDEFAQRIGAPKTPDKASATIVEAWTLNDHLDAIVSLGVTQLVDRSLAGEDKAKRLSAKEKHELQALTALYYRSRRLGASEALRRLQSKLSLGSLRPAFAWLLRGLLLVLGAVAMVLPFVSDEAQDLMRRDVWFWGGAGLIVLTLAWTWIDKLRLSSHAKRTSKHVRVLPQNVASLTQAFANMSRSERADLALPGKEGTTRYDVLDALLGLLERFGYTGVYVLLDRVDEPSLIAGRPEQMRMFVQKLLDMKLLQYPNLALKLFLPIELESIHRNASSEEMKRMRLDKSNLVPELKWTGQELQEIANQRLRARLVDTARAKHLTDLFEEGFDFHYLRETLTQLGTPRYAFGFLSSLIHDYVRDLPEDLDEGDPSWRVSRHAFDITRSSWLDRTGVLRRSLN